MSKKVLVILANGFEEVEFSAIVDILRRGGVEVVIAGTSQGVIKSTRGIGVIADTAIDDIITDSFDMLVLPGGEPGVTNLRHDSRVQNLVKRMYGEDRYVAAICAAPAVLADAGLLADKKVTSYPGMKIVEEKAAAYSEEKVVVDGRIITSRGPATAIEFGITLLRILAGDAKAKDIAQAVLLEI